MDKPQKIILKFCKKKVKILGNVTYDKKNMIKWKQHKKPGVGVVVKEEKKKSTL